jgi:hypothetical protein
MPQKKPHKKNNPASPEKLEKTAKHIVAEMTAKETPDAAKKVTEKTAPEPLAAKEETPKKSIKSPQKSHRLFRAAGRFALYSSVPEILLVSVLILSKWLTNSDFSYPQEVFAPVILLGILGTFFYYVFRWILRRPLPAHAAALPLMYGLYSYSYSYPRMHAIAHKLVPKSWDTPFTTSLIYVLFLAIVLGLAAFALDWIIRHVKPLQNVPLLKITVFVVLFLFAGQLYKTGARLWDIRYELAYKQPASFTPAKPTNATITAKPNVYYLLFDRYANADTLAKAYNYNNDDLLNFLGDQGFVTRDEAYANYPFTMQSTSSTLGMTYFQNLNQRFSYDAGKFQTAFPYRATLDNPPVVQALKQNGYTYNQVSSWWDFTRNNIQADNQPTKAFRLRIFGMTLWMTDLQRDIVNKSILSPFLKKGVTVNKHAIVKYDLDTAPRDNFEQQMAALKNIAANSRTQKTPQFTFAHVLVPHDPYIFGPDGSDPAYDGDRDDGGADETVKYTNQLTYLNMRMKDLIANIRAHDPNAAIVIQADEGPYPKQFRGTLTPGHYYNPVNLPLQQMQQKFGVLASYYLPGMDAQTVTEQATSSVDIFRVILNNYLGYSMPLLPDCQFATGDKYQLYGYELVSGKLKGTAEPAACKPYL